jgi:hypothetical protein
VSNYPSASLAPLRRHAAPIGDAFWARIPWSQFLVSVVLVRALRERSKDRFASVNEDLRMSLDFGLRIWKRVGCKPSRARIRILRANLKQALTCGNAVWIRRTRDGVASNIENKVEVMPLLGPCR